MKYFFALHGTESSPYSNWLEDCYNQLENEKEGSAKCFVPHFPTFHGQKFETWAMIMDGYFKNGYINKDSVFICHSSSCIFSVRYLIERKLRIDKLICVSGFNNYLVGVKNYDEVNSEFFSNKAKEIKKYAKNRICIFSDNDPFLSFKALNDFANEIEAKKIIIKNGGHINKASGFTKMDFLKKFL